jgi:hypothetical protein
LRREEPFTIGIERSEQNELALAFHRHLGPSDDLVPLTVSGIGCDESDLGALGTYEFGEGELLAVLEIAQALIEISTDILNRVSAGIEEEDQDNDGYREGNDSIDSGAMHRLQHRSEIRCRTGIGARPGGASTPVALTPNRSTPTTTRPAEPPPMTVR